MELKTSSASGWRIMPTRWGSEFFSDRTPWHLATDVALPCATQNGWMHRTPQRLSLTAYNWWPRANMPLQRRRHPPLHDARVLFARARRPTPGVATSGLEMSQNAQRLSWTREEVDARLKDHDQHPRHLRALRPGR